MKENEKTGVIPLFFSVDDKYIPYLAVAIRSIICNLADSAECNIHLLTTGVSEENRRMILAMSTPRVNISFCDVGMLCGRLGPHLQLRDYYSASTYYRLFIPELFPQYERGIYLDCDIVVTADISELYNSEIGECLVGAVTDEVVTDIETFRRYSECVIELEPEKYFNAGVLIMNLRKMRETHFLEEFSALLCKRRFPVAQDQDYLNILCRDKVLYLSGEWNKTPFPYSPEKTPKLIHFKLNFRPWRYDGIRFESEFWKYAKKTEYIEILRAEKENYTDAERERDRLQGEGLLALAEKETENAQRKAGIQ